jgi:hypothetical protein
MTDALISPPEQPVIKVIGFAQVVPVTPESVIVIYFQGDATPKQIEDVQNAWRKASGLPNRVVALANGIGIKVVDPK